VVFGPNDTQPPKRGECVRCRSSVGRSPYYTERFGPVCEICYDQLRRAEVEREQRRPKEVFLRWLRTLLGGGCE
jgi:hypothetical protein